ncbi:GNAT family N-acetyltransferase [Agrobacterium larrymoorei]|uniref:GNAT family N-acetyltransferase n=1 Tax=Agrobacterium larrymoorei TaxID=160699 RepID=A0AAF0H8E5_9HYPH|nr:GNAT family N-acetyltransferase [Agrobacterium larrymoorei]WHA41072.1 GNAT family N-acetyltransferase [Agrobacterium larrymoorei]
MNDIRIAPLALHPEHVSTIVAMLHAEWGSLTNWSDLARLKDVIESRLHTDTAPLALVAVEGDKLLGTASIKRHELPHHPDKEFWIGDVIVASDQRGRGIGRLLVTAIIDQASKIGITELHLYTPDQEGYYENLGWQTVGRDPANGEDNVIMRYVLDRNVN